MNPYDEIERDLHRLEELEHDIEQDRATEGDKEAARHILASLQNRHRAFGPRDY